jgi:hypothetical protein
VDLARHAARVYSAEGKCSEQEALTRIHSMFISEWKKPTDLGITTVEDKQVH